MARDEQLVRDVRAGKAPSTLRIYRWTRPAVSLGRAQNPADLPDALGSGHYPVVRRPTGGGAVLHDPAETTYALALTLASCPRPLHDLPVRIHQKLLDRLRGSSMPDSDQLSLLHQRPRERVAVCFTSPVCGDLLYRGRKVGGSAVRVWKEALLLQGSLQGLPLPPGELGGLLAQAVREVILPWR